MHLFPILPYINAFNPGVQEYASVFQIIFSFSFFHIRATSWVPGAWCWSSDMHLSYFSFDTRSCPRSLMEYTAGNICPFLIDLSFSVFICFQKQACFSTAYLTMSSQGIHPRTEKSGGKTKLSILCDGMARHGMVQKKLGDFLIFTAEAPFDGLFWFRGHISSLCGFHVRLFAFQRS